MEKTRAKGRRGQSLVEAALALPILVMLMLGLLDLGRAYYAVVSLKDAADEGATYASIHPADVTGIRRRAADASRQLVEIDPNDVSVTYPPSLQPGSPITVTTAYRLELFTPFVEGLVGDEWLTLEGRATHAIMSLY